MTKYDNYKEVQEEILSDVRNLKSLWKKRNVGDRTAVWAEEKLLELDAYKEKWRNLMAINEKIAFEQNEVLELEDLNKDIGATIKETEVFLTGYLEKAETSKKKEQLDRDKIILELNEKIAKLTTSESGKMVNLVLHQISELEELVSNADNHQDMDAANAKYYEDLISKQQENLSNAISKMVENYGTEGLDGMKDKINNVKKTAMQAILDLRKFEQCSNKNIRMSKFSGIFDEYAEFRTLFNINVIKNTAFKTPEEKLGALKGLCVDRPLNLIKQVPIASPTGLEEALKILDTEYKNDRRVQHDLITELTDGTKVKNNGENIQIFLDMVNQKIGALAALGINVKDGVLLAVLLYNRLPVEVQNYITRRQEAKEKLPTLDEILKFSKEYKDIIFSTEIAMPSTSGIKQGKQFHNEKKGKVTGASMGARTFTTRGEKDGRQCLVCNGNNHRTYKCPTLLEQDVNQRWATVRKHGLCKKCLSHKFKQEECRYNVPCSECKEEHNILLHNYNKATTVLTKTIHATGGLMPTIIIQIKDIKGDWQKARALVDQCSDVALIREDLAKELGLKLNQAKMEIEGSTGIEKVNKSTTINISPRFDCEPEYTMEAFIRKTIVKELPLKKFETTVPNVTLADPKFSEPGEIHLILGVQFLNNILTNTLNIKEGGITFTCTTFGWVAFGEIEENMDNKQGNSFVTKARIEESLEKFWKLEQLGTDDLTNDDMAEKIYKETTKRKENGSFIVNIPFIDDEKYGDSIELGNSHDAAISRFIQGERKREKNPELKAEYKKTINEYIANGWMVKAKGPRKYTIPHQAVEKYDNLTTKVRVVFDASAKSKNGLSLNDVMYAGQKIQPDLQDTMLLQRKYEFAITSDIKQMYPHIWVNKNHWPFQTIVWRENQKDPLEYYYITVVVQGEKGAQFLAVRTLKELGQLAPNTLATQMIEEEFYADNYWGGAHDIEVAKQKVSEITQLLAKGGFTLRKWLSNYMEILDDIEDKEDPLKIIKITEEDNEIKTLGIYWDPNNDYFTYKIHQKEQKKWTKRIILSEIASIYDPLGWLTPLIVKCKIIMQDIWKSKIDWDDAVPEDIFKEWMKIREEIPLVETFKIPRWLGTTNDEVELFGFADASKRAFGSVIYSRQRNGDGYLIRLVSAKSRINPINNTNSIARSELNAAVLLVEHMTKTELAMKVKANKVFFSDSQIVLAWNNSHLKKRDPYVDRRVRQMQRGSSPQDWYYVKSEDNPADIVSRGALPSKFINLELWREGPSWITRWEKGTPEQFTTDEEIIPIKQMVLVTTLEEDSFSHILEKDIRWGKLKRIFAYVMRWQNKLRGRNWKNGIMDAEELLNAEMRIIRHVQKTEWSSEIKNLKEGVGIKDNKLQPLNPIIDLNGIIRIGSRILKSELPAAMITPIILPKNHSVTKKIIIYYHEKLFHAGTQLTLTNLRERYWIPQGRSTVNLQLRKCILCHKYRNQNMQQLMGILPKSRVTPSNCFTHTSVDYAGPMEFKGVGKGSRPTKGYVAVFVCMCTKAIHLEAVPDLTSEKFINAFNRFISVENKPTHMYSDNGTTFVGANRFLEKELKEAIMNAEQDALSFFADSEIVWKFNPPTASHMGGLWEAGVKSMKTHLKTYLNGRIFNFEEMQTILYRIAACLNTRPICGLSEDPNDLESLTPGHFMRNMPKHILPGRNLLEERVGTADRYRLQQQVLQSIWKRWQGEYLTRLHERSKWTKEQENIKVNDLVLVKEDNLPPGKWRLGRILDVHPGPDNLVRVVTVKTKDNILKRPIHKLSKLPIDAEETKDGSEAQHSPISKRRSPISKTFFTMAMMLCMIGAMVGQSIQPLPKTDVLFSTKRNLLVQHGVWKLHLTTNINVTADKLGIESASFGFSERCNEQSTKIVDCYKWSQAIKANADMVIRKMQQLPHIRTTRGSGVITKLWNFAFGSSVSAEEFEAVKGQLDHANEGVRILKKTTMIMEDHQKVQDKQEIELETKLWEMYLVNQNISNALAELTNEKLEEKILQIKNMAESYIDMMSGKYSSVIDSSLPTFEEFIHAYSIIIASMDRKDDWVNSTQLFEWHHVFKKHTYVQGELVVIMLEIPLIERSIYKEMEVIPIPNEHNELLEITHDVIAYNSLKNLAFYVETEVIPITSELGLVGNSVFYNAQKAHEDCVLEHVFNVGSDDNCKRKKLPDGFNIWKKCFDGLTFIFYSSKPLEISTICNQSRMDFVEKQGVLKLKPGCRVSTFQHEIIASTSLSSKLQEVYVSLAKVDYAHKDTAYYVPRMPSYVKQFNQSEVKVKSITELHSEKENHYYLVIGITMGSIIVLMGIFIFLANVFNKPAANNTNNISMESIEMEGVAPQAAPRSMETMDTTTVKMSTVRNMGGGECSI